MQTLTSPARHDAPRILVPQGWVTTTRPAIEWEGVAHASPKSTLDVNIRVTSEPHPERGLLAEQTVPRIERRRLGPGFAPSLPPDRIVWLWVRERAAGEAGWSAWNAHPTPLCCRPTPAGPADLYVYNLNPTRGLPPRRAFEEAHLVSVLQGLANRAAPRLFVRFMPCDDWWLERLREDECWLAGSRVHTIATVEELVATFRDSFQGVVIWDRAVAATSNVASTIAGVEGLIPVAEDSDADSLWRRLVEGGPRLPVGRDLRGLFTGRGALPDSGTPSTGSAKCDAYVWARERYLDTGLCDPMFSAYYMDAYWTRDPEPGKDWSNHTLTNHDYFVARRAFFWDLGVWPEESAVDDPGGRAGLEREVLIGVLRSAQRQVGARGMIRVGGFTPWAFKYTEYPGAGGNHHGVHTEWETVRIITQFDGLLDADALHLSGMANASLYGHFPLPDYLVQGPAPTEASLRRDGFLDETGRVAPKTYVLHYVGDYDAAAWVNSQIPDFWQGPERGRTTLSWAINPNLAERAPHAFEYFYRTRMGRDSFQSGDSGAGYVNPAGLLPPRDISGLPSAADLWIRHNLEWFRRMNLTVTGFIINALSGMMTPEAAGMFAPFSPDGIVMRDAYRDLALNGFMVEIPMRNEGLPRDEDESAALILGMAGAPDAKGPTFVTCRSVLYPPSYYAGVEARLREARPDGSIVVVDPRTFFYLARLSLGGTNDHRATWLFDTAPRTFRAGSRTTFRLGVRNDGADSWAASGGRAVSVAVGFGRGGERRAMKRFPLPADVSPGDAAVVEVALDAPTEAGSVELRADIVRAPGDWFSERGGLPLALSVRIE